jgi:hypothetical protein
MMPRKHAAGDRYGRLKNIEAYVERKGGQWYHLMRCDCGSEKLIAGNDLSQGKALSCGCFRRESKTKHGLSGSPEYAVWAAMIQRCTNKKHENFNNYGGRGISVSDDWISFSSFIVDMGGRPTKNHTLERVDNEKGYSKENCVWANRSAQAINTRTRKDNKSGVKGVSIIGGKFVANINRNGRRYYLGRFKTIEEAALARRQAENQLNHKGEQA